MTPEKDCPTCRNDAAFELALSRRFGLPDACLKCFSRVDGDPLAGWEPKPSDKQAEDQP